MASSNQANDPTEFVERGITRLHQRIIYYLKTIWKRVRGLLAPLRNFLKKLIKVIKQIAVTVGKKVVDMLTRAANLVLDLFDRIEALLKKLFLLGKRVLTTLKKETDKTKLVRVLKTVVRKYIAAFRQVASWVTELWDQLDILNRALALLDGFRMVLQLAFRWIAEVTAVLSALRRIRQLLRGVWKALKKEVKEAIKLGRDVAKMPVPKPG